jgi:exopolyphosphatase/guanosine-5'-triphosphate,3'-diphosphate pyrophosphatase
MKLLLFDIGSNSVRTARLTTNGNGQPHISGKRVYTTRLAEGLAETHSLDPARIRQSLLVIRSVHAELSAQGFFSYAYATSAVRDAQNGAAFVASVEEIIGIGHVRVLTGEEEAAFAQRGADPGGTRTIIDIGGGSTQIVRPNARESWPIGCVRAKDLAPFDGLALITSSLYPVLSGLFGRPESDARSEARLAQSAAKASQDNPLGVGGTITTLALLCEGRETFAPWAGEKRIESVVLSAVLNTLSGMGDEARAKIPLLKDRHDVILHGGVILQFLMDRLNCPHIGATLSDGLDGYAMHLFRTLSEDVQ